MTRDEILNMPAGRELDALIAETILHKKVIRESSGRPHFLTTPYSKDIGSAWEVVEKFTNNGFVISRDFPPSTREFKWCCEIFKLLDDLSFEDMDIEIYADTAPLAICRAALLVVMEKA